MFGRVGKLERQIADTNWKEFANRNRILSLEKQVADLMQMMEWHVGTTTDIILAERKLTKLKIAEDKRIREEVGVGEYTPATPAGPIYHEEAQPNAGTKVE